MDDLLKNLQDANTEAKKCIDNYDAGDFDFKESNFHFLMVIIGMQYECLKDLEHKVKAFNIFDQASND